MTKREKRVSVLVHTVYYLFMVWWWLWILIYLFRFWWYTNSLSEDYDYVRAARALSAEDIVEYKSVEPEKDVYWVWEQVSYISDRRVKSTIEEYPSQLLFEDTFFCDVMSERKRGVRWFWQMNTTNNNPVVTSWFVLTNPWNADMDELPDEPAVCYWRHNIKVCPYIEWVPCKVQTIISWPFVIK